FADEKNILIIERLRAAGLQFEAEERVAASERLAGLAFVISGSFADHSRDELKALIEAHGGKNLAAVSANTSYLLAGDKIGPAKLQKANKLGVKIISEQEFIEMIVGDTMPPQEQSQPAEPTDNNIAQRDSDTKNEAMANAPENSEIATSNVPTAIQGSLF
ncbi:MAG: NAD-dependent DNA ligase LigA, partial [Alistipes sp.]|nr:NAD-dependent DNA ligase LigA [Alistipes sp.]